MLEAPSFFGIPSSLFPPCCIASAFCSHSACLYIPALLHLPPLHSSPSINRSSLPVPAHSDIVTLLALTCCGWTPGTSCPSCVHALPDLHFILFLWRARAFGAFFPSSFTPFCSFRVSSPLPSLPFARSSLHPRAHLSHPFFPSRLCVPFPSSLLSSLPQTPVLTNVPPPIRLPPPPRARAVTSTARAAYGTVVSAYAYGAGRRASMHAPPVGPHY
ncbi:hypothetical protein FB451DRAFT_1402641 [Mycena latifolia]|nr:hypothetical protein FB451DRAFT_1402641 [Mycena latifolia]